MSNSTNGPVTVTKGRAKFTPPGYDIVLTEKQTEALIEMMQHPGFKVFTDQVLFQRKDHIARKALNSAQTTEQLQYYKGMAAELQLVKVNLKNIKKAYHNRDTEAVSAGRDAKQKGGY